MRDRWSDSHEAFARRRRAGVAKVVARDPPEKRLVIDFTKPPPWILRVVLQEEARDGTPIFPPEAARVESFEFEIKAPDPISAVTKWGSERGYTRSFVLHRSTGDIGTLEVRCRRFGTLVNQRYTVIAVAHSLYKIKSLSLQPKVKS